MTRGYVEFSCKLWTKCSNVWNDQSNSDHRGIKHCCSPDISPHGLPFESGCRSSTQEAWHEADQKNCVYDWKVQNQIKDIITSLCVFRHRASKYGLERGNWDSDLEVDPSSRFIKWFLKLVFHEWSLGGVCNYMSTLSIFIFLRSDSVAIILRM